MTPDPHDLLDPNWQQWRKTIMGCTPEGRVKLQIRRGLDALGKDCVYCMPVPYGYGSRAVDFIGCIRGHYFAIEAKRPDYAVTTRHQQNFLDRVADAGGVALVARSWDDVVIAFTRAGILTHHGI